MDNKSTQDGDAVINADGVMHDAPASEAPMVAAPAPPQSVMDVTPPPHDEVVAPPAVEEMPDLATEHVESSDVAPEPALEGEAPAVTQAEAPAESGEAGPPVEQTNIAPAVVTPTGADAPVVAKAAKKSGKGLVIAIAVILALVLASAAVLFYLRSKDNKTAKSATKTTIAQKATTLATSATPISSTDIDTASKGVDSNLSGLDESKDYNPDALSDKSLGLQ